MYRLDRKQCCRKALWSVERQQIVLVSAGQESNEQMKVSDYSYHSCANASVVLHLFLSSSIQEVLYPLVPQKATKSLGGLLHFKKKKLSDLIATFDHIVGGTEKTRQTLTRSTK